MGSILEIASKIRSAPVESLLGLSVATIRRNPKSARLLAEAGIRTSFHPERRKFEKEHGFAPVYVAISPTYKCNLNCDGCYSGDRENSELDLDMADRVVEEASTKWGVVFFRLSGGEPLIPLSQGGERLRPAIEIAKRHPKKIFQMFTNGTLINDQLAAEIAEMGNLFPFVSIEGREEDTDKQRGEGVYKKALQAMNVLTSQGVVFGASFTLSRDNAHVYEEGDFYGELMTRGALVARGLTYMPTGRGANRLRVASDEQRQMQGEALRQLGKEGKAFYGLDYLNNPGLVSGCGVAGLRYAHVGPEGNVYGCSYLPIPAIFNVRDAYRGEYEEAGVTSLEDIILKDPLLKITRQIAQNRPVDKACLLIDDHEQYITAVASLVENYPAGDFGDFFAQRLGMLASYLEKLRNF